MPIDPQTLALVLVFLMAQATAALLFLTLGHPHERGIRHAGFAVLTQALGASLVLVLRNSLPSGLVIGLGFALLLGGTCYLFIAVRLFYGRRFSFWHPAAAGALVCFAFLKIAFLHGDPLARLALASLMLGLVSLALAWEFGRKARDEVWVGPRWLCAGLFLGFGLAVLVQSLKLYRMPSPAGPLDVLSISLPMLAAGLVLYAFMGLGLALVLAQRLEARQQRFAQSDLLTGLANRRGFEAYATRVLARARTQGQFTSLLLLDVDHFKRVNDAYGHGAGDLVLESLGDLLHQHLRERDGAGRHGGEALTVLLPDTHQSFAAPVAERIRQAVEAMEVTWEGRVISVTISIGVASTAEVESDLAALYQLAAARLTRAKAGGRNQVVAD
ncbi:MAG: GGDEF domain-containing protein [Acidobacteria bacterium]|nr:GGDEF domain-containing protein [Acidobacteriota bacterium]MBI3487553.1 GGDEF domain-containing protein [Acidobacteriota bacterium]